MASKVCVDASLALKLVLSETDSDQAEAEWQKWVRSGIEIEAPFLFIYETTTVLRNRVYRREITQSEAEEALGILAGLRLTYLHRHYDRRPGNWLAASIAPRRMTVFTWHWRSWKVVLSGRETGVFTTP